MKQKFNSFLRNIPARYVIVLIATMANTLEYALRDNMSISMVAMTGLSEGPALNLSELPSNVSIFSASKKIYCP